MLLLNNNMRKSHKYNVKQKKPDKKSTYYDFFICMKKQAELIYGYKIIIVFTVVESWVVQDWEGVSGMLVEVFCLDLGLGSGAHVFSM